MNKTITNNQTFFGLHLEYSEAAAVKEKAYRELEKRFFKATGFFPTKIDDSSFVNLPDEQQTLSISFWNNAQVSEARKALNSARALAQAYFDAYADRVGK